MEVAEVGRAEISGALRELMVLLRLRTSVQLAALLRNPDDRYPSDGLVRTYLLERQDASPRFVKLVLFRRAEVETQLAEGLSAVSLGGRVETIFRLQPKQHIVTILDSRELAEADFEEPRELAAVVSASLAVPRE